MLRQFPIIIGPTASGKTSLSIALAHLLNKKGYGPAEIVNADSMLVYSRMDIGTAKPTLDEREGIPHHLISVLQPHEIHNVGDWYEKAQDCIWDIRKRGGTPIVCGGSHLYAKVLLTGIIAIPSASPHLRKQLEEKSPLELHELLQKEDPKAALVLHENDVKRTVRALEVIYSSGKRISDLQVHWDRQWRDDALLVALWMDRECINPRINQRVKWMFDNGIEEEVQQLWNTHSFGKTSKDAIGYKELIEYFEKGNSTIEDVRESIKIGTRRLAKKQRSWLRRLCLHPQSLRLQLTADPNENFKVSPSVKELAEMVLLRLEQDNLKSNSLSV